MDRIVAYGAGRIYRIKEKGAAIRRRNQLRPEAERSEARKAQPMTDYDKKESRRIGERGAP